MLRGDIWIRVCGYAALFLMMVAGSAGTVQAASVVTITAPLAGATVSGQTAIAVSFGTTVTWVNVYIDGSYFASSPPSLFSWNTAQVANGSHTISANAYAASGALLGNSKVSVNVINSLLSKNGVAITNPLNGSTVQGTVSIAANVGASVSWINFYVDSRYLGSSPPDNLNWNTSTVCERQSRDLGKSLFIDGHLYRSELGYRERAEHRGDGNSDADAHSDPYPNRDRNPDVHSHANADSGPDRYSDDRSADSYSHCEALTDAYIRPSCDHDRTGERSDS